MKQLTCEMCGSTDLLKQEGVFVCQTCGTKYSVEEAKKMMIEGTVQVEGTVKTKESDFVIRAGVLEKYNGESTKVIIPDSVKKIEMQAFKGLPIEEIVFPDDYPSVDMYACVTIGNGTTSIDYCSFKEFTNLISVILGNNIKNIGNSAFKGCTSLRNITIPNGVTSIGDWAFSGCSSLASIKIPSSVTSIGLRAFDGCSSLTSITIPDSVTSIDACAFVCCTGLTSITIPDSVTSIGQYAFADCKNLKSVVIPKGASIGTNVFNCCSKLEPTKLICESYSNTKIPKSSTFSNCGFVEKGYCANCAGKLEKKMFGKLVCPRCGMKY